MGAVDNTKTTKILQTSHHKCNSDMLNSISSLPLMKKMPAMGLVVQSNIEQHMQASN